MRKKVTIKDIAEYVGVSPMTVSFVLNQKKNQKISKETTQKVLDAVEKFHYIPNNAAKALRSAKTYCIGVVLEKTIMVQRYAEVLEGIRAALSKYNYSMLLCNAQGEDLHKEYIQYFRENKVDGIIYVGRDGSSIPDSVITKVKKYTIPFVALDCEDEKRRLTTVNYDYFYGAYHHTKKLIQHGAKGFLYIRPHMEIRQEEEREKGVRKAAREAGDLPVKIHYLSYEIPQESGEMIASLEYNASLMREIHNIFCQEKEYLETYRTIICSWGTWVEPVLIHCMENGMEYTLAGLAEGGLYSSLWKHISYSKLPNYRGGYTCVELLMDEMENDTHHDPVILLPELPES